MKLLMKHWLQLLVVQTMDFGQDLVMWLEKLLEF